MTLLYVRVMLEMLHQSKTDYMLEMLHQSKTDYMLEMLHQSKTDSTHKAKIGYETA